MCHNINFLISIKNRRCEVWVVEVESRSLTVQTGESSPLQYKHPQQAGNFWSNLESFVDNLMMEKLLMETSFSKHRNPVSRKELHCPPWMLWKIYKNKSSSGPNISRAREKSQARQKQYILYISFVVGRKSLEKVGLGKMMCLGSLGRGWYLSSNSTDS